MRSGQPPTFLGGPCKGAKILVEGKESQSMLLPNLSKEDLA